MKTVTVNIEALAKTLIADLGNGPTSIIGDKTSGYFTLVRAMKPAPAGQPRPEASVSLIKVDGEQERYYTVHLVDDINETNCELYDTPDQSEESLVKLLQEIAQAVEEMASKQQPPAVPDGWFVKVRDLERKDSRGETERWQRWEGAGYIVCVTFTAGSNYVYIQVFTPDNAHKFLPDLYVREDGDLHPVEVAIHTKSVGALAAGDMEEYISQMQRGLQAARIINEQFVKPLREGTFDKGELIPEKS